MTIDNNMDALINNKSKQIFWRGQENEYVQKIDEKLKEQIKYI